MRARFPLSAVIVSTLVLAACGGDDEPASSATTAVPEATSAATTEAPATSAAATEAPATAAPTTAAAATTAPADDGGTRTVYPLTIDNCGRELTFDGPPERALILNGTSVAEVQTFLELGIEGSILANSQSYGVSDIEGMVERIAALPTGGLELNENFEVPKEQTLALEPDFVISTWAGGFTEAMGSVTRDELEALGIAGYVTPVNCSYGDENARPEDVERNANQTYEESFELIRELGIIFDVQDRAEEVIAEKRAAIEAASVEPGDEPVNVLVAYPGMSMMNPAGNPQVFAGPLSDSIIEAAGGVNSFDGFASFLESSTISAEALAAADVDVLVVGLFLPGEDPDALAEQILAAYPQWDAAQTGTYTWVAEGFYLGPHNDVAIAKIADAIASLG